MNAQYVSAADLVGCRYRQVQRFVHPEVPRTRAALLRLERVEAGREAVHALLPTRPARGDRQRFRRLDVDPVSHDTDPFHAELATLEALAAEANLITGAVFTGHSAGVDWRVDVDILVRRPDGTYLPVIVSNHRVARADERGNVPVLATARLGLGEPVAGRFRLRHHVMDGYRLALAARALQEIGVDAGVGAAIGQDRSRAFLAPTQPLQPALTTALEQVLPTFPRRVKECATCRFWPLCEQELQAADDISLFLAGDRALPFRERGITTVSALIDADLGEPSRLAAAWRDGVVLLRRTDTVSAPVADVEIDVDMEAYLDQGAYLWGAFDGQDYHPFATWLPLGGEAEAENFARFWQWLMGRRAQAQAEGKTFAAYCWSNHGENHWLTMSARRFAGQEGVPTEGEVKEFISSPEWVDVFRLVRSQLVGTGGLGLKVVAPQAGYTWEDGDFDGEESVHARRIARGSDPAAREARRRLLRYNEDDCRATAAVRAWLRRGAPGVEKL
ncbi:TM0106 family RecB-like putative nuclease [Corynebacterium sp.]|uniref:TM0106 family RecB-like putative nuclease n=1 Tax=Corynebacterium sp. TaxID=1720 RepID=UPI0026E0AC29|nr:TM0106 family RecB-like putative nuclease [Corynebacterium sp.]MDO5512321.1 TM0106 family RecB-like putative nuclease [Corynebacterium sp.]